MICGMKSSSYTVNKTLSADKCTYCQMGRHLNNEKMSSNHVSIGYGHNVPYFSAYKTESFPFQNNPKNLDPSYMTDLDL